MMLGLARAFALGIAVALTAPVALAQQPTPPSTSAPAAQTVETEVFILHATNDGTGIDPKIGKMPELSKPPFSAYNSYKQLERPRVGLPMGQAKELKLPNGRTLQVTYKTLLPAKARGESPKYVISLKISKPGAEKEYLPLLEVNAKNGERFFVAGQAHRGGVLVIGIQLPS